MDVNDSNYTSCPPPLPIILNCRKVCLLCMKVYWHYTCVWKGLYCTSYVTCLTYSQTLSCRIRIAADVGRDVPAVHFLFWFFHAFSQSLPGYYCTCTFLHICINPCVIMRCTLFFSFSNCICWYYNQRFNKICKEKGM